MERVAIENEEATRAWNGVLFDRFVAFRDVIVAGLAQHGDEALRLDPPKPGDRVLDIGCGFGDASQQLAAIVGPEGEVLGVDVAERFIEAAREEAAAAGVENVRFLVADLEVTRFEEEFDYAFARFGTMFFANPVAALRNVHEALVPGARFCMVVWRRKLDNPWLHVAEQIVDGIVEPDPESDEPTCGPGPFSMAGADTTSDILLHAGFTDVAFRRYDREFRMGANIEAAVEYVMALGPAGEALRLAGSQADELEPQIVAALRDGLAEFERPDGVLGNMSTWIVTARAPTAE